LLILLLLASLAYLSFTFQCSSKEVFNASHPFTATIPILTYIAIRNATSTLRSRYSRFLAWFGRHSLETFVLQYHIWLAADTKGLLHLGILDGWLRYGETTISSRGFWIEVAIITAFFLRACSAVSNATYIITNWIVCSRDMDPVYGSHGLLCYHRLQLGSAKRPGMRVKVLTILFLLWLLNVAWSR
jgi:N-acetylneuraminate 9-O-acetyltransferase